ncbi:MAG TPA: glycosyltransferase 87 family protein [Actinophytocola sp.]|uniref:glycosyltransferase 87 family protein n=1 Tax=Actinophytocola sp. TaxID=1872138 RepID=UPI002DDCA3C3|nr:glycosyltransferase 87 family protein [Actinophytocola sp.]HEV2778235.1 glycosyltransferase 87 family protein [Actinophytocola sp.]
MTAGPQQSAKVHVDDGIARTSAEKPLMSALRWLPLAVVGAIAIALVERAIHGAWPFWMEDFDVQRMAAAAALHGDALYHAPEPRTGLFYTHTPFAALLFIPFALVPATLAGIAWYAVEALFLELAVWIMLGVVGVRRAGRRAGLTLGITLGALLLDPIDYDLRLGQPHLMLMVLVLADFVYGAGRRWHGVGIGLAAGVKLVPLIFILYLLLTRRIRAAITAAGTFLLTVAVGFAFLPGDSVEYFGRGTALNLPRIGLPQLPFDQSLRGVLARLGLTGSPVSPVWLVTALLVVAAGLLIAVRLYQAGERTWAVLACGLTSVLVSPVSWEHYWVWVLPIMIMLGAQAVRHRSVFPAVLVVLLAAAFGPRWLHWFAPVDAAIELRLNPLQQLAAAVFPLAGLILLLVLAITVRRRRLGAPRPG